VLEFQKQIVPLVEQLQEVLEGDLASAKKTYDAVYENSDCRKTDSILGTLKTNLFKRCTCNSSEFSKWTLYQSYLQRRYFFCNIFSSNFGRKVIQNLVAWCLGFGVLMPVKNWDYCLFIDWWN
jgi:hypothetical protein